MGLGEVMATDPDTDAWLGAEIVRARKRLDEGAAEESVRVLADAERVAVAQGYPQVLAQVRELAEEIASRSQGATRRRAQRIIERLERRSRVEAAASRPRPPRPVPAPLPTGVSRVLVRLAGVVIAASIGVPLLALALDSELLYGFVYAAGYLGVTWLLPGVLIGVARSSWRIGLAATLLTLVGFSIVMALVGIRLGIDLEP